MIGPGGPVGLGQYNGLGEYCGQSTASKVFLSFTRHYNAIISIS